MFVLISWALLATAFTAVAVVRLLPRGRPSTGSSGLPNVLLLRPLDAPSPRELLSLSAPIDYRGTLQHVVLSPYRPELPASAEVVWLPSDPLSPNRKVGHLLYALASIPRDDHTVVIAVDADVEVDGPLVQSLVDALAAGAAVASAAPQPSRSSTLVGRAVRGLLVQSHHSFRALDAMSAGAKAVCGKAMAFSPAALAELTGLDGCIGEDLELSHRLHVRGLRVSLAAAPARVPQTEHPSLDATVERFTRWMKVLRAHRPPLFPSIPLLFAPTPVLLVLAAFSPWLLAAVVALVVSRCTLAAVLEPGPVRLRFDWLLAEGLLLWCWAASIASGRTVTWRGRTWRLGAGGAMR